jgi:pimeloyl-ACP methyl ester carboxylesterase
MQDGQFDEELEACVNRLMTPRNLQEILNRYRAVAKYLQRSIDEGVPSLTPIKSSTYILWGGSDTVLRSKWLDNIEIYFPMITLEITKNIGHFVHYVRPSLANHQNLAFFSE